MHRIFIGAMAGVALAGTAVSAAPGGNGKDHGGGHGGEAAHGAAAEGPGRGQGEDQAAPAMKADRERAPAVARREERQEPRPAMRSPVRAEDQKPAKRDEAAKGPAKADERKVAEKNPAGEARPGKANAGTDDRDRGRAAAPDRPERKDLKHAAYRAPGGRQVIVPTDERVRVLTERRGFDWGSLYRRSAFNGCPPGLAKKYNGCMPPGLDRQRGYGWLEPDWYLRDYDRSYRYRYLDGYMLRLGAGDSVLSYIPLLGGALALGQVWPSAYEPVALPPYYDDYYDLGPADSYRYYDDAIYRVDPDTAAIQSVAALLTGNAIAIGEPMPAGYDVYNVPYGYRDQYYDGPDALYRYSDGYIYQLDPTTRLVQAAIELLA